jgi:2',3'-cyclic-nucleotide 2'-phosphodiesterase (5'-nucleotidase family)
MDFSEQLQDLENRVAATQASVKTAATENHDQLKKRIGEAQVDMDRALKETKQEAAQAGDRAQSGWAQIKADASAKVANVKEKADKRAGQIDARMAGDDAQWAEADAQSAIDFADWAVENARLVILDAIDARVYANERAHAVGA